MSYNISCMHATSQVHAYVFCFTAHSGQMVDSWAMRLPSPWKVANLYP